jgi:pimeloyl-ACP methyl ester carboxylesterase
MADDQSRLAAMAPLSTFGGEPPPAPDWYVRALADAPEALRVEVAGAGIETLAWGKHGKPGLMFLHGAGAHAGWWRPIAPFFADDYRVAAISLSGMGGSDWRGRYSVDQHADEVLVVARAAGLFESGQGLTIVGHSFGGRATARLAVRDPDRLKAVVILDSLIDPPGHERSVPALWPPRPTRVYATLAEALARFRLAPYQPCENLFLVDAVARESLGPPKDGSEGWTWRFDPMLFVNGGTELTTAQDLAAAKAPFALMFGARSKSMPAPLVEAVHAYLPDAPLVVIPQAEHHVMLDQPLMLVAALKGLFAGWPGARS